MASNPSIILSVLKKVCLEISGRNDFKESGQATQIECQLMTGVKEGT